MSTSPRIRVLFCIQSFAGGGAEGVTLNLARALAPARFAPTIFAHKRFGEFEPPASTPEVPIVIHNRRDYRRQEIATDCPSGPREILDGGRAGILLPVGNVPTLAQALGRVLFDPAERKRLGQAAPGRAAVYDVANWARQWGKLLVHLHAEKSLRAGKAPASGPRA